LYSLKSRVCEVTLDPRTPVLVGQAQISQHEDDVSVALGPTQLMAQAVRAAISDAGVASLGAIDALHVLRSLSNREPNPGRSVARELGLDVRITGLTPHGGNLPQSLVNYSSLAISRGEIDMVVLTGGEASRSRRRAKQSEV
jgi:acetyl-CoA C-acetyltransferase